MVSRLAIALVWLYQGLWCKVLGRCPGHQAIVEAVPGLDSRAAALALMLHLLKRHPLPVRAFFRHCLVLTYALPERVLAPLLPPGLTLDSYLSHDQRFGFLAIALVQTEKLRPVGVPAALGQDFFLSGQISSLS